MKRKIGYLLVLAPVLFTSCSKELSCKNDCMLKPQAQYDYYSVSQDTSFRDVTGNAIQDYSWSAFDTTTGILDTVVIDVFRTLKYSFTLSNPTDSSHSYVISVGRYDILSQGSMVLMNHYDSFPYGPLVIPGLSVKTDTSSRLLLNHDQLSCVITAQNVLNRFAGSSSTHVAFNFTPITYTGLSYPVHTYGASACDTTNLRITYFCRRKSS
jgi:hypothetical protein